VGKKLSYGNQIVEVEINAVSKDFEVLQRDLHNPLSDCASLHVKFVELYSVYFKF